MSIWHCHILHRMHTQTGMNNLSLSSTHILSTKNTTFYHVLRIKALKERERVACSMHRFKTKSCVLCIMYFECVYVCLREHVFYCYS